MPTLKRYLSEIPPQRKESPPPSAPDRVEFILRTTMRTLAKSIAHFPDELRILEWRDLERVLREVFEGLGFNTRLTPPAQDGGFDLELSCVVNGKPETFLVEVKHWTFPSRPGRGILEKFFEVVVTRPAVAGLLLSTSGFTTSVVTGRTEIERQRIRLGDSNKIVTLCQYYVRRDSGLWKATLPLPELLFDGTL
ncbi:restriction endonuclease [Cystobacter fuscus]|uniref:restriction endonuclease n=1 Tax=Cystobacter fuscus TaxID=43 RepID=UPI0037C154F8